MVRGKFSYAAGPWAAEKQLVISFNTCANSRFLILMPPAVLTF